MTVPMSVLSQRFIYSLGQFLSVILGQGRRWQLLEERDGGGRF